MPVRNAGKKAGTFTQPICVFTEPLSFARTSQIRTDAFNTLILGMAISLDDVMAITGEAGKNFYSG